MGIVITIHEDMKEAMRSGNVFRRDTLRLLESAIKNIAIEKRIPFTDISDEDVYVIIRRGVKQRTESAVQYRSGGREDLAKKEEEESAILSFYLPAVPDESVIRSAVENAIVETGALSMKDMGKVMGAVKKSLPSAPGADVRRMIEELLTAA